MTLTSGTKLVMGYGDGIGIVQRAGRRGRAAGYWVSSESGDPGASRYSLPTFCPDYIAHARVAVVGRTVCRKPRGECWCGLHHVTADYLSRLPTEDPK